MPAATTGLVHPIWAMIAMVASVSAVLGNSFRGRVLRRLRGEATRSPQEQLQADHRREHDHGGIETAAEAEHVEHAHETPPSGDLHQAPDGAAEQAADTETARHDGTHAVRLHVPMHCHNCAERIETRVSALAGVQWIRADHEHNVVIVEHTADVFEGQIRAKLHEMGFDVTGHEEASP